MRDLNLMEKLHELANFEKKHLRLLEMNLHQLGQDGNWLTDMPESID